MAQSEKNGAVRQRIALEAARIMADQHSQNYEKARQKAAQRLGCNNKRLFPSQAEIEQALRDYLHLFHQDRQPAELQRLRILAVEAMNSLEQFRPQLAGQVLDGTADSHSRIELHLFAENPEEVILALISMQIPWNDGEKHFRFGGGKKKTVPAFRFQAGDTEIELILFPPEGLHQTPLEPLGDKPQLRASLSQLKAIIAETEY